MIFTYRILTFFLFPFLIIITYLRRFFNKEDKIRFKEKISVNESFYPKNKKIIWIHAASIGETNSVIPLIIELINKFISPNPTPATTKSIFFFIN